MLNIFYECSSLTSVAIGNSVTSIGSEAFSGCTDLTSVTIGNSVTSIGSEAFRGCTDLTSVTIPNSVISIGEYVFQNCSGLTSVIISSSMASIGSGMFKDCSGLTSITIPNSVTSIGNEAFHGCTGLTSFAIPNSVKSIGEWAFYGCRGLTSVTIGNSVTSIGDYAFCNCSGLTSINIPNSVTNIGNWTFNFCRELSSITVNKDNKYYDSREDCNAVIITKTNQLILGCKNSSIPNSVTNIGDGAFSACSGLTSIFIPNSVTAIGSYAFSNCKELTDVYCNAIKVPKTETAFEYFNYDLATLYVPASSLEKYKLTKPWSNFSKIIAIDDETLGVKDIDDTSKEVSFNGKHLIVMGTDVGTDITVYNLAGKIVGSAKATSPKTTIETTLKKGETGIVKIGEKRMKIVVKK